MSEILNKLLKIDELSKNLLQKANEECVKINESLKIEENFMLAKIKKKAEDELKNVEELERKNFHEKISQMEEKEKRELEFLKNVFYDNCNEWVQNIVFKVIKQ